VDFFKALPQRKCRFAVLCKESFSFSYRIINYLFMKSSTVFFTRLMSTLPLEPILMHSRNIGFLTFKTAAATNLGDTSLRKRFGVLPSTNSVSHQQAHLHAFSFHPVRDSSHTRLRDSSPQPVQLNQHGTHIISGMNLGFKYVSVSLRLSPTYNWFQNPCLLHTAPALQGVIPSQGLSFLQSCWNLHS